MITMLFGPPGCGKGTQATELAKHLAVPHIATGDIFRRNLRENTPLGITARSFMANGGLVPDHITCEMVADRLANPDCANGALLDGFPRTVVQAHWVLNWLGIREAQIVSLVAPTSLLLERMAGRRVCAQCSTPYHVRYNPPPANCTVCGSTEIVQRQDDQEAVVLDRLQVYERDTAPVLGVLSGSVQVHSVDGVGTVDEVRARILQVVRSPR